MTAAVSLESVGYSYRGSQAVLSGVSVRWPSGVIGLLGPNGSGKSTLLGLLAGTLTVQRGTVRVLGAEPTRARDVGYLPQQAEWPGQFTVTEFLAYLAWSRGVRRRQREQRVRDAIRDVDLAGQAQVRLSRLSGGQRRRAMLAQTLLTEPAVLVLDEPTTGFDPTQRVGFRSLIARLAERRTVVVATHLVEDVEHIASWLCVLREGRVAYNGPVADLVGHAASEDSLSPLEAAFVRLTS
ncbi:MAG: ATP-binding cassette domain-containing protein [Actinomycetales bacterium]